MYIYVVELKTLVEGCKRCCKEKSRSIDCQTSHHATLCDHIPGLSCKVISNPKCWVALEPNHSSMATFSNLKAGKETQINNYPLLFSHYVFRTWVVIQERQSIEGAWERVGPGTGCNAPILCVAIQEPLPMCF